MAAANEEAAEEPAGATDKDSPKSSSETTAPNGSSSETDDGAPALIW